VPNPRSPRRKEDQLQCQWNRGLSVRGRIITTATRGFAVICNKSREYGLPIGIFTEIYQMFSFRPGRADDLPAIYRLERLYIETMEPLQLQKWLSALERHLQQWVENLPRTIMVEDLDQPIGYVFWERENDTAILASINVDPGYRRRGIATNLLLRFEHEAALAGCLNLELGCLSDNPARRLYESFGYIYDRKETQYVILRKKIV
jgi:ribosomal protein S18 acetylase RimI-like enzyme